MSKTIGILYLGIILCAMGMTVPSKADTCSACIEVCNQSTPSVCLACRTACKD